MAGHKVQDFQRPKFLQPESYVTSHCNSSLTPLLVHMLNMYAVSQTESFSVVSQVPSPIV